VVFQLHCKQQWIMQPLLLLLPPQQPMQQQPWKLIPQLLLQVMTGQRQGQLQASASACQRSYLARCCQQSTAVMLLLRTQQQQQQQQQTTALVTLLQQAAHQQPW
jgi:hypothetical protein